MTACDKVEEIATDISLFVSNFSLAVLYINQKQLSKNYYN